MRPFARCDVACSAVQHATKTCHVWLESLSEATIGMTGTGAKMAQTVNVEMTSRLGVPLRGTPKQKKRKEKKNEVVSARQGIVATWEGRVTDTTPNKQVVSPFPIRRSAPVG